MAHQVDGVAVELEVVVDEALALKQTHITLRHVGLAAAARRVRVVAVAQWQLGARWADRASICTHQQWVPAGLVPTLRIEEAEQRALVLHATQTDAGVGYGLATAFLALRPAGPQPQWAFDWTADRRELFDARGHAVLPDELGGRENRDGLGLDPCAALSLTLTVRAGQAASHEEEAVEQDREDRLRCRKSRRCPDPALATDTRADATLCAVATS